MQPRDNWTPQYLPVQPQQRVHTINPNTGIWPISEWGWECGRGFVSIQRFDSTAKVIPRANRAVTKKWYRSNAA